MTGYGAEPARTIANDAITAMLAPGLPWKWNQFYPPVFYVNGLQQDYATSCVQLGWISDAYLVDINNTSIPKPVWMVESVRDLPVNSWQGWRPGQVAWLPNDQLQYGSWAASTTFQKIFGTPSNPGTTFTQIYAGGNYWIVSNNVNATVTTGDTEPAWPQVVTYPSLTSPNATATTVTDGSVIWQCVNPKGQGFRINPLPAENSLYFELHVIGQLRPPTFKTTNDAIPIPDDFLAYFRQGFIALAYKHSPTASARARWQEEYQLWQADMMAAISKAAREREQAGFYPSESIGAAYGYGPYLGPAWPFGPWGY